ncbi:hypothetical protein ACFW89_33045, partial [Streptomyces albidoflavus]
MSTTLVTPETPAARKRRRKTRTKNVSHLPPLVASQLKASQIDLTPGKEHLVCAACERWTPITGVQGTPKLVPHHTGRAGTAEPRRCSNTNRRVVIDIDITQWRT